MDEHTARTDPGGGSNSELRKQSPASRNNSTLGQRRGKETRLRGGAELRKASWREGLRNCGSDRRMSSRGKAGT